MWPPVHLAMRKWSFSMSFKAKTPVAVMKRLWADKTNGFTRGSVPVGEAGPMPHKQPVEEGDGCD